MRFPLIIALIALFINSCGHNQIKESPAIQSITDSKENMGSKDTLKIEFSDMDVYVVGLSILSDGVIGMTHVKSTKDTFSKELDMETNLENAHFFVTKKNVLDPIPVEIQEARTHVMTLQNEGPHLDLYDWNPFYTQYQASEPIGNHRFHALPVDYDNLEFKDIDYPNLIAYVDSLEGASEWADLIRKLDSDKLESSEVHYPLSIGVGYRWFRIQGELNGQSFKKWIQFILPQGC